MEVDRTNQARALWLWAGATAALSTVYLVCLAARVPWVNGVPSEWSFPYRQVPHRAVLWILLLHLGPLWLLARWMRSPLTPQRGGLFVPVLVQYSLIIGIAAVGTRGLFVLPDRIYNIATCGYLHDAAQFSGLHHLWGSYEERMSDLSPHGRVHPPGPATLLWLTSKAAGAITWLHEQVSPFDSLQQRELFRFRAEGVVPGCFIPACASLWLLPLHALATSLYGVGVARIAVGLGALAPSVALWVPTVDTLTPLSRKLEPPVASSDRRMGEVSADAGRRQWTWIRCRPT